MVKVSTGNGRAEDEMNGNEVSDSTHSTCHCALGRVYSLLEWRASFKEDEE